MAEVAILGAGHGGCAAAADLTSRGHHVRLHARSEERLKPLLERGGIEARGIVEGFVSLDSLTTDIKEAISGTDVVMLVVPSTAHEYYANLLAPILTPNIPVFLNPGHTCGGLHFVHELKKAGYTREVRCCETVTLTYICRMEGPTTVGIYTNVKNLLFGAFPAQNSEDLIAIIKSLYSEIIPASNVLETALSNMNAVFHPPGMLMNTGWVESTGGDFLFYRQGMSPAVGRVTSAVDKERMAIAKALGVKTRSFLDNFFEAGLTTKEARDSNDISRACYESMPNRTIKSPSSLDDRYIHEDVGYGLVPMSELGRMVEVPTPTIDSIIRLVSDATDIPYYRDGLTLDKMGINNLDKDALQSYINHGR